MCLWVDLIQTIELGEAAKCILADLLRFSRLLDLSVVVVVSISKDLFFFYKSLIILNISNKMLKRIYQKPSSKWIKISRCMLLTYQSRPVWRCLFVQDFYYFIFFYSAFLLLPNRHRTEWKNKNKSKKKKKM